MRQIALLTLILLVPITGIWAQSNRFEGEILAFEASDRTNAPPKRGVVFVGSSSIRLWKTLEEDFPKQHVIKRGFGGSEISDSIHYAKRIVIPYAPRLVVMYAGGNDIHNGKTPGRVFSDFTNFVATVHAALPRTHIAYISIAPNPARWAEVDRVRAANTLIADYVRQQRNMKFIDVFPQMLGADGQPRPEIYGPDRLHMNEKGYALWKDIVKRYL